MNLHTASNQWAHRPDDERYWDLDALHLAALAKDQNRTRIKSDPKKLRFTGECGDLLLEAPDVGACPINEWAFRQISAKLGCPAEYLQSLPSDKTAELLNYHLQDDERRLAFAKESVVHVSQNRVECMVSSVYGYIPNHSIVTGLKQLQDRGWVVPPGRPTSRTNPSRHRKATAADVAGWKKANVGWGLGVGSELAPSGLYLGDRNMFAFLVRGGGEVDLGAGQVLQRGAFFRNSEVGDGACTITMFAYDHVCGNHIVWDVQDFKEISIRHLGKNAELKALEAVNNDLNKWIDEGTRSMVHTIECAKTKELGASPLDVINTIFSNRRVKVSMKDLTSAYRLAKEKDSDRVNPRTVWGMVTGLTRLSQEVYGNADKRTFLDAQIPNLLAMAN